MNTYYFYSSIYYYDLCVHERRSRCHSARCRGVTGDGVFRAYLYQISRAEDTPCSAMSAETSIAWS